MTIVHHGCDLFWQISPMAMMHWNNLTILLFFFPHFYFDNFPPWSCLHLSGATNLWKNFPVKIICRYNLTIFHPGCESFFLVDNFPPWLSTFFDNFTMRLLPKNSSKFGLTILLLFVLKLVDNFTFWQKYSNPADLRGSPSRVHTF